MVRRIEEILGIEAGTVEGRTAAGKAARSPAETAAPRDTTGPAAEDVLFGKCLLKAETLYRNYEYSAAIPLYESCLQIDENNVAVRERLAAIYQRRGEYKLALEQWEKILLLEPGNAEAERQVKKIRNLAETTPAEPQ
jgi:tetratricopeptide (TPR) repeat protein